MQTRAPNAGEDPQLFRAAWARSKSIAANLGAEYQLNTADSGASTARPVGGLWAV